MNRTNNTDLGLIINVFNFGIVKFISMHKASFGNKFFGRVAIHTC